MCSRVEEGAQGTKGATPAPGGANGGSHDPTILRGSTESDIRSKGGVFTTAVLHIRPKCKTHDGIRWNQSLRDMTAERSSYRSRL